MATGQRNLQYYVFWFNGGRLGSLEKTEQNFKYMSETMNLRLIQKDITGTEHYEVSMKTPKQRRFQK